MRAETVFDYLGVNSPEDCEAALRQRSPFDIFINFEENGIEVGAFVPGSELSTIVYPLRYQNNFSPIDLALRVEAIETEAQALWKWANEETESGYTPIQMGEPMPDIGYEFASFRQAPREFARDYT